MNIQDAIQILKQHNEWRRDESDIPMLDPKTLGIAIDTIVEHHKSHNTPEPPPKQGEVDVVKEVIKDAFERRRDGIRKYGTPLMTKNNRKSLVDAYQEILDHVFYIKQYLIENNL